MLIIFSVSFVWAQPIIVEFIAIIREYIQFDPIDYVREIENSVWLFKAFCVIGIVVMLTRSSKADNEPEKKKKKDTQTDQQEVQPGVELGISKPTAPKLRDEYYP